MKRGEPFNVLRNPNSWSNAPRAESIVIAVTSQAFAATVAGKIAIAAVSLGLSVATSAIISALTPAPPTPKQSLLVNSRSPVAPQDFIYGEARKGGTVTYLSSSSGGKVLHQVISLAGHEVESIEDVYLNNETASLSPDSYDNGDREGPGWVTSPRKWSEDDDRTKHEIRVFYHRGNQTSQTVPFQNSSSYGLDNLISQYNLSLPSTFVGEDIAYLFVVYSYEADVFDEGLPLVTAKIKGKKVYDPRTGTTAYSNNAALCIRDFITSAYGLNDSEVDDVSFSIAANTCDELIPLVIGNPWQSGVFYRDDGLFITEASKVLNNGIEYTAIEEHTSDSSNEPGVGVDWETYWVISDEQRRYTIDGVVRADQSYGEVLQQMMTACGGTLFWGGGKWKLVVGEYNAPTKTLTLDDLRSNIFIQTRNNLRDQFNRVQGTFVDKKARFIATEYPPYPLESEYSSSLFLAQDDGVEQPLDLDLPFTTSSAAAQRLAKMTLFRGREQQVISADFGLNAFDVEVGEIIKLDFRYPYSDDPDGIVDRYGWGEGKEFEVVGWNFNSSSEGGDLRITLTLRETSSAAFDWDGEESEIIENDSDLETQLGKVPSLQAAEGGLISADGTFINSLQVTWAGVEGANGYEIQWRKTEFDYTSNGGIVQEADAVTEREQFIYKAYTEILYRQPDQDGFDFYNTGGGSSLTEDEVRAEFESSTERETNRFSKLDLSRQTFEHEIVPVFDDTLYDIKVRAISNYVPNGPWSSVTFRTSAQDTTAPDAPTGLSAVGSFGFINLSWVNPPDVDFNFVEVWESTDNNLSNASQISVVPGNDFKRGNLSPFTTRYYWVRAVDYSGNKSSFAGPSVATTEQITAGDIGNAVIDYDNFASDVVNLFNSIQSDIGQVSDDTVALESDVSTLQSQFTTLDGEVSTNSTAVSGLETRVTSNEGSISTNASQITSLESSLTTLDGEVSGNATAISGLDTRVTDNEGDITAQASQISSLSTTVDGNTTTVTQVSESVDGIEGRYGVEIDNNGNITGYQLLSGVGGSAFNVRADQFAVFDSNNNGGDNPFTILTTSTTIDGVTYPAGTYVQNTLFAEAISVGTTSQGLFVNSLGKEDAVYVYQDSDLIYGLFVENFYNPGFSEGAGGAALFKSFGGFTVEINNTENNQSTDDAAVFAQNSDSRLSVGGAVWLGESGLDGGYGVNVLRGGYYDTSGEGYLPFTGSHEAMVLKTEVLSQGDIVCDHAVVAKSISDSFTEVVRSTKPNMPSAIGVYKGPRSSGWVGIAAFVDKDTTSENSLAPATNSEGEKVHRGRIKAYNLDWTVYEDDYTPIFVNSVGEGAINVCGEAGNISKGDLIVTSNMAGKGMRQSDDIVRSYTVAKAREDVTFSSPTEVKMIACIYLCG